MQGVRETIQRKWLTQGPEDQPITNLTLTAYKYDDLRADNEFIAFYFFRVSFRATEHTTVTVMHI